MISLAQESVVLWGEMFQRLSLNLSPARSDSIPQSPLRKVLWDQSQPDAFLRLPIHPRTSRTSPGRGRWAKPISSADQTRPVAWGQRRTTILGSRQTCTHSQPRFSHAGCLQQVPSLSVLSLLLMYQMEITLYLPHWIKCVNSCAQNNAQHPVITM